jgi:integrase
MARTPKYRRHSARDLGFIEHAGKREYFPGPYGSQESYGAYVDRLRQLGYFVVTPHAAPDSAVSLPVLIHRFNEHLKTIYPPGRSRGENLRDSINKLLEFAGAISAVAFTPLKLKAFQAWLVERPNPKRPDKRLSRRTINDITSNVKFVFKWAVSEELIPVTVWQALLTVPGLKRGRTSAKELPPKQPVPWDRVKATLPKLSPVVRAMVQLHWLTGARSQSICLARPEQFDCSGKLWVWRPRHKSEHLGHQLVLFVGPKGQKILGPMLKGKAPDAFIFQPRNKTGKRSKGYRAFYTTGTYRNAVRRAARRANVPHWSPHLMRHSRGTIVRDRHGIEAAQAALGHVRLDATQIYAQKRLALAKMVAETMG